MGEAGERNFGEKPLYKILLTRHAERLPSGALSPDGIEAAKRKGESLFDAEIVKAYASDDKSKRTVVTGDIISQESDTTWEYEDREGNTQEKSFTTREVSDIGYDVFKPDLYNYLKTTGSITDVATVEELDGLAGKDEFAWVKDTARTTEGKFAVGWEDLSQEQQIQVAPIRARNQRVGYDWLLQHEDVVHRAAFCAAHQLLKRISVAGRHAQFRDHMQSSPENDVIMNIVTHRIFTESLLLQAGYITGEDGEMHSIKDINEFGGWLEPLESIEVDFEDPANIPAKIPVIFEKEGRPQRGTVFLDLEKMKQLDKEYLEWKAART